MYSRILAIALCLAASPALAITVQDGDFHVQLLAHSDVLMTGGTVEFMLLYDNVDAVIEGGVIGGPNLGTGITIELLSDNELTIRGGALVPLSHGNPFEPLRPAVVYCDRGNSTLTVQGTYFRVKDYGSQWGNGWAIQGWLADGTFTNFTLVHEQTRHQATIIVELMSGVVPQTPGDTNYDDVIDLQDLNNVRNNFDGSGAGDTNQDGQIDVEDLNLVRNNFGRDPWFTLPSSYEVRPPQVVPEPPALFTSAIICVAAGLLFVPKHCSAARAPNNNRTELRRTCARSVAALRTVPS